MLGDIAITYYHVPEQCSSTDSIYSICWEISLSHTIMCRNSVPPLILFIVYAGRYRYHILSCAGTVFLHWLLFNVISITYTYTVHIQYVHTCTCTCIHVLYCWPYCKTGHSLTGTSDHSQSRATETGSDVTWLDRKWHHLTNRGVPEYCEQEA